MNVVLKPSYFCNMYIVQVILGVALMKISADDGKLCESHGQCYGRQSLNQQTCRVGRCRIHPDSRVYNLSNNPAGKKKIKSIGVFESNNLRLLETLLTNSLRRPHSIIRRKLCNQHDTYTFLLEKVRNAKKLDFKLEKKK